MYHKVENFVNPTPINDRYLFLLSIFLGKWLNFILLNVFKTYF